PRARVVRRKLGQMARQMLLDLALGFSEEREVPAISERACGDTQRQRTRVPDGIQQAEATSQLVYAIGAPGEVVFLLARCLLERSTGSGVTASERLALIQRLRAHLANVIYPHQRGCVLALRCTQLRFFDVLCGRAATGTMNARNGPERCINAGDCPVQG